MKFCLMKKCTNEKIYEKLMKKCITLAKKAKGKNLPNPYVGAIVFDDEKKEIISFGYHKKFGEAHAEVEAIKNAKNNTKNKTLIVNLEPCSHFGKTPPCADLIIKLGFKRVVIGFVDPNPKVAGKGIEKLKNAGIEVICGVLEKEARELNKIFLKNILFKKPYCMLKIASTLDSKTATEKKKSKWITNEKARFEVQKLRSSYQAILTGSGTVLADDPRLNVRLKNKKSPIRIIFDPNNKLTLDYKVFAPDGVRIILVNNSKIDVPDHIEQISFVNFDNLFKELYLKGIFSIMVESGAGLNSALLKEKEIDEINLFMAPKIFGSGFNFVQGLSCDEVSDAIELENIKIKQIDDNILINGTIRK